jgi:hypothetical protein
MNAVPRLALTVLALAVGGLALVVGAISTLLLFGSVAVLRQLRG